MQKYLTIVVMILWLMPDLVLGQSAIGQKANYSSSWPAIEYESNNTIAVAVHDQRPYIVNGQTYPTYVGTVRGGFGNPFDVNTQSDKPLSDDISSAIVSGFKRVGTQAESVPVSFSDEQQVALGKLKRLGHQRIVLITIKEWRSDSFKNHGFFIDAILRVYDKNGKELASSSTSHKSMGSGDGSVNDIFDASRLYLSKLLNDPKVKAALNSSVNVD